MLKTAQNLIYKIPDRKRLVSLLLATFKKLLGKRIKLVMNSGMDILDKIEYEKG